MFREMIGTAALLAAGSLSFGEGPKVVGWRGDGSGVYPDADPRAQWQRITRAVAGLRVQAEAPKGDGPSGQACPDGVIRELRFLRPVQLSLLIFGFTEEC